MQTRREYMKLSLKGLPSTFSKVEWESSNLVSFARFQRFITNVTKGNTLFAYNENGEIINRLLAEELYEAKDIRLVDFAQYFRESFDSKDTSIPLSSILYVFNVGNEEVKDYSFSDKKLFNIIQTNRQQGNCIILVSNSFSVTTFKRNYPISSSNLTIAQQILKID